MSNVINIDLVRQGDAHLKRAKRLNPEVTAPTVNVVEIINTQPQTFTVSQLAGLVGVHPQTVRRAIDAGQLKAAQSGEKGHHRISYTEAQLWWQRRGGGALMGEATAQTPQTRATEILAGLDSDDSAPRNAAIVALARADAITSALVEEEVARSVEAYDGPEDDFSDWRALDGQRPRPRGAELVPKPQGLRQ